MDQHLRIGTSAPDFTLFDQDGDEVRFADLSGKRIVYFYPKAFTPGCTSEACDFRDSLTSLESLGYTVLGISGDEVKDLRHFAEEFHLPYRLLSDPDGRVAQEWGAWGEKSINGQRQVGRLRSTFVINEESLIESAEYNVQAEGHVRALRQRLEA